VYAEYTKNKFTGFRVFEKLEGTGTQYYVSFKEELTIDSVQVNYYLGLVLLQYFEDREMRHVLNFIRAYQKRPISREAGEKECLKYRKLDLRNYCKRVVTLYVHPIKPWKSCTLGVREKSLMINKSF
jgi:hypothetical protein